MIDSEEVADGSHLLNWLPNKLGDIFASTFARNLAPVTSAAFLWRDSNVGEIGLQIRALFPNIRPTIPDGYIKTFEQPVIGNAPVWWTVLKMNWIGDCSPPLVILSQGPVGGIRFRGSGRLRSAFTLQVLSSVFPRRI